MAEKRKIEIVPYEDKYRQVVRDCVYDTGFGGDGAEIYFEDRELFADMLTIYYTDYEPESAFIPLVDGEPAGYLLGCLDTERSNQIMKKEIAPKILKDLLLGKYTLTPKIWRNIVRGIKSQMRGEHAPLPLDVYPAHLHIDLFAPYRRFGVGGLLINNYLDFLRVKGIHGVHLGTSTAHTLALPFYEKLGFTRFGVCRMQTSFFREIIDQDFYNVTYVKLIR